MTDQPEQPAKKWYRSTPLTILFLILFFPLGLFMMWKYTGWSNLVKGLVTGFFVLVIFLAVNTDSASEGFDKGWEEGRQVAQQDTPKTPEDDTPFSEKELSQETIMAEMKTLSGTRVMNKDEVRRVELEDNLGSVEVEDDKVVTVYYEQDAVWDEKHIVSTTADTMVAASEKLFQHPQVSVVRVVSEGEFTDQFGVASTSKAVSFELSRPTAEKIQWDTFKDMVLIDYQNLINIADTTYIHPAIRKALN